MATAASGVLLAVVLVRDVGLNPLNGWTIALGLAGGVLAMRASSLAETVAASVLVLLALVPALVGGFGLVYVPSLVLIPLGARRP